MLVQLEHSKNTHLLNALQYCHFSNPVSDKLIIKLSEKLQSCPKLLTKQLILRVEQLPLNVPDPKERLKFLNKGLLGCEKISNGLKESLALNIGVSASEIH